MHKPRGNAKLSAQWTVAATIFTLARTGTVLHSVSAYWRWQVERFFSTGCVPERQAAKLVGTILFVSSPAGFLLLCRILGWGMRMQFQSPGGLLGEHAQRPLESPRVPAQSYRCQASGAHAADRNDMLLLSFRSAFCLGNDSPWQQGVS